MSRLRGRRSIPGKAFWGGILAVLTWGTAVALLALAAAGRLAPPNP